VHEAKAMAGSPWGRQPASQSATPPL